MGGIRSYRDLRVWQEAMDVAADVYKLTSTFPSREQFGLTSQVRRAAVSVAANIAEGYGRDNRGDYVQFLRIAQGSLKEVETLLILAARVGCSEQGAVDALLDQCDQLGRQLHALIRSLQRSPAR